MKRQRTISSILIEYKDDEYAKDKLIDLLISFLLENTTNIKEDSYNGTN